MLPRDILTTSPQPPNPNLNHLLFHDFMRDDERRIKEGIDSIKDEEKNDKSELIRQCMPSD